MAFCKNCGAAIEDGTELCSACAEATANEQVEVDVVEEVDAPSNKLNVGYLVWSILNIVLGGSALVPLGLGVAALVFTILGYNAKTAQTERQHLKLSKTFNLISTIVTAVSWIIAILIIVLYLLVYILIFVFAIVETNYHI